MTKVVPMKVRGVIMILLEFRVKIVRYSENRMRNNNNNHLRGRARQGSIKPVEYPGEGDRMRNDLWQCPRSML
jgi:hypothetical protein